MSAKITKEKVTIPTYQPGAASDLPMFFENKPYQGASGRLYPIPFSDRISDEKRDVEYEVYTLENEYIKTQVLPQLGGKILRGYDKIGRYDFIYYNEVVKPALVGLAGPWISGGIEFNWPQHHRPTTFMPMEAVAEENETGEKTVWTGEIEPLNRMKGMAGITVAPGRSYIKAKVRLYNRTALPQVFMWWANLAVPANENYRTVFPPDVEWVNDHDRRCVLSWPVAKGVYHTARPYDYGEGTDVSKYSAVKVPSSFLVAQGQSDMDFIGGYDEGKQKGIVTVSDHHISPGKKMWHWGAGDFGDMWCSNLTDKNGPYIELMTGVYTDNQPDFTWMAPYESRTFEQYWYPIRDIGDVKNASIDAAMNVEQRGKNLFLGFHVTGAFSDAVITVKNGGTVLFEEHADLTPEHAWIKEIPMEEMILEQISASLSAGDGKILVEYKPYVRGRKQPIVPRKPVARPAELATVEELYMNGVHLEQYKQHNYDPRDYYQEGLKRDKGDIRCNTAMARLSLKNGMFEDCIRYCNQAIERMTSRNRHPADTEAMYLKGLALKHTGKYDATFDLLYEAGWDYRYRSAAYYELAAIDCINRRFKDALDKLDVSIALNQGHTKAMNLKSAVYRQLGEVEQARKIADEIRKIDLLDLYSQMEQAHFEDTGDKIAAAYGQKAEDYIDVACNYISAGLIEDALFALDLAPMEYPLLDYYRALCYRALGKAEKAVECCERADHQQTGYCFPARLDDIAALKNAAEIYPNGANAYYYLGCLYYDRLCFETAIENWEKAIENDGNHAKAFRNLALAYFDKRKDCQGAKICMEMALKNRSDDPRILFEYQQLLKNMNISPEKRLEVYDRYNALMLQRDDSYLDKITLKCMLGEFEEAIEMAKSRRFHIYEGGEGKLTKLHAWMHVLYGNQLAEKNEPERAGKIYRNGLDMPKSYGEAKTFFNQEAHIYYYLGLLQERQGKDARNAMEEASVYKAAVSELSLFRALALRKLMKFSEAKQVLDEMMAASEDLIENSDRRSYYGVGSPSPMPYENDVVKNNLTDGYILRAYAQVGLGRYTEAEESIERAEKLSPYDFRVFAYRRIERKIAEK